MIPKARGTQILLVTGTALLTAALYLAPQFKSESHAVEAAKVPLNFEGMKANAAAALSRDEAARLSRLEGAAANDSLMTFWDGYKQPALAAHYAEEIAKAQPTERNWIQAAFRYFDAFQVAADSSQRLERVNGAIRCYEKALEINPENLDVRTDLGICYVEVSGQPMKGIQMLRDVVAKDPNHENAQFNLGLLSIRSGQYAKAVERFEKVLAINPARKEMYFMIGRAWMMQGDKEKARENLEKFRESTTDPALVNETNALIQQLNNN